MVRRRISLDTILPLVFFLGAAAALAGLWGEQRRLDAARVQVETAVTGDQIALRLSAWIQDRLAIASYFARVLGDRGQIDPVGFQREADRLQEVFPGFQALNFIDPDRVIRIVTPEAPNLAALGRNLDEHPDASVPAALGRSEKSDVLTRSAVIDLLQGGKGLATYRAIRSADGRLIGFLNAVFRIEVLVDHCLSEPGLRRQFWFRVEEPDGRLAYQTGPAPPDLRFAIRVPVPLTEEPWRLEICPTTSHLAAIHAPAQNLLPAAGMLLAAALALLLRAFLARRRDLLESQAQYRLLVENAADLIVKIDPQGRFTFVSPSYCRITGRSEQELLGSPFLPEVHEDHRARTLAALATLVDPPHTTHVEMRAMTRDGWRWVAWSGTAVLDGQGRIRETIGVGEDITQRKDLEAQLLQSQKLQAVGQLAGGIAHDFNNILHSMLGSLDMLRDDLPPGSAARPFLEHIQASADRGAALTRQLLAFGRRQTIDRRPLDLDLVVTGMLDLLQRSIGERIRLIFTPGPGPHHVLADPIHIEQVLLNLCVNARDAIAGNGAITIGTSRSSTDDGGGGAGSAAVSRVVLTVSDDGCGMTDEVRSRIFEPFFTTKAAGRGTGLGLATVFGIVAQHDGAIECDSAPGRGTTFTILLPATAEPVAADGGDPATVPLPPGPVVAARILLAEDNVEVRNLTTVILQRAGYQVAAAESGEQAMTMFAADPAAFSLAILDLVMPGLGGREAGARMREVRGDLPLLFMSGYDASSQDGAPVALPNSQFLAKPFPASRLKETVSRILATRP
jgi:PAS domain S-box-containing protein